ncbi:MAG: gamma-glutamylcyclotransferase family protein [Myxococcota bacterium]
MPRVFTYGPDALQGKMYDRIGPTEFVGGAFLHDYRLVFDKPNLKNAQEGLVNLRESPSDQVFGAVFELSNKQFEMLDGFFGGYEQRDVRVETLDHNTMRVRTWFARRTRSGLAASPTSLASARLAMTENGAPEEAFKTLDGIPALPEPEPEAGEDETTKCGGESDRASREHA